MTEQSKSAKQRSEIARLTKALESSVDERNRLRALLAALLRNRPGADREAAAELAWQRNKEWAE